MGQKRVKSRLFRTMINDQHTYNSRKIDAAQDNANKSTFACTDFSLLCSLKIGGASEMLK